jgi:hypothetical protein
LESARRPSFEFSHDRLSDPLQIDLCAPYAEQDARSLHDGVVASLNPKTNAVENSAILGFQARIGKGERIELPLLGTLKLKTG